MSCNQRCHGCAFTPGSEANREPHNHLRGLICLLAPAPFFCHEPIDWQNEPSKVNVSLAVAREFAERTHICRGWQEGVQVLAATGYYRENPTITKFIGLAALEALEQFLAKDQEAETKQDACERLQNCMEMLGKKRRKFIGGEQ